MSVIAGCFYGLTHLLTNFTHSVQEGITSHCLIITILCMNAICHLLLMEHIVRRFVQVQLLRKLMRNRL